ncbi:MAG: hypothetical protein GX647_04000 [Clostridiales bacterium]|jgi:hypothetical protein|nr:hypothetical protein [Clostridiales bacterium]
MNTEAIVSAISTLRAGAAGGEYDLHAMIARALTDAGISFSHEYRLAPRRRIDFLVGSVGVEVKKGRPGRRELVSQLERYLESDELAEVVVVARRAVALPRTICGKRVTVVSLNRLWGVSLP